MQKCLVNSKDQMNNAEVMKTGNPYSDIRRIKPLIDKLSSYDVIRSSEHELAVFLRELPSIPKRKRILDAGCGPGLHLAMFNKENFRTIGIDSSPFMIEEARKRGIIAKLMNVKRLEFGDNTFHGIWCNTVLHQLDQYELVSVLNEFRRVLVNGGLLFVSVKSLTQRQIDNFGRISNPMTQVRLTDIFSEVKMNLTRMYLNRGWIEVFALKPRRSFQTDPQLF